MSHNDPDEYPLIEVEPECTTLLLQKINQEVGILTVEGDDKAEAINARLHSLF